MFLLEAGGDRDFYLIQVIEVFSFLCCFLSLVLAHPFGEVLVYLSGAI